MPPAIGGSTTFGISGSGSITRQPNSEPSSTSLTKHIKSPDGANAFLKTLEEPPAHTRFVLATTDPEELLPTIVSRCQRFDFRRHTIAGIAGRVKVLAARESIQLTEDAIQLVAQLAHGSMRDPVGLLEQLSNFQSEQGALEGPIDAEAVRELVGMTRSEIAIRIVSAIGRRDATEALAAVNEAVDAGQDVRQLNRQVVALLRDGLQVASGLNVLAYQDELKVLAANLTISDLVEVAAAFLDTESQIRSSVMPHLPLELAVLKSTVARSSPGTMESTQPASPPPKTDPEGAASVPERRATSFESMQNPVAVHPASTPEPAPTNKWTSMARNRDAVRRVSETAPSEPYSPEQAANKQATPEHASEPPMQVAAQADVAAEAGIPPGDLSTEFLVDMWPNIRADIKSLDRRTEALMLEIDPIDVIGDRVTLASPYEFHRNMLNDATRRSTLEDVISRRTGRAVRVEVVLKSDFLATHAPQAVAPPNQSAQPEPADAAPTAADEDGEKFLGAVLRIFDGEIIDETPEEP